MRHAGSEPSAAATMGLLTRAFSSVDPDPECRVSGNATLPHRRHARPGRQGPYLP